MVSIAKSEAEKESAGTIILNILKEMADLRLLKENVGFLFVTLSGFFVFAGYFIPFLFIPLRIKELGLEGGAWILSTIGEPYILL